MSRLAEDILEGTELVDRCIVCGGDRTDRIRRAISQELGGASGSCKFTVEYCADDAKCGEAAAMELMGVMGATFVAVELRRRRQGNLLDLGIPAGEA